jgi:hypothetical protein
MWPATIGPWLELHQVFRKLSLLICLLALPLHSGLSWKDFPHISIVRPAQCEGPQGPLFFSFLHRLSKLKSALGLVIVNPVPRFCLKEQYKHIIDQNRNFRSMFLVL